MWKILINYVILTCSIHGKHVLGGNGGILSTSNGNLCLIFVYNSLNSLYLLLTVHFLGPRNTAILYTAYCPPHADGCPKRYIMIIIMCLRYLNKYLLWNNLQYPLRRMFYHNVLKILLEERIKVQYWCYPYSKLYDVIILLYGTL